MPDWPLIKLMGPEYRFQGQRLEQPCLIYVQDHHYDESQQCIPLRQLVESSLCDHRQHVLMFDHVSLEDEFPDNRTVCLPLLAAAESHEFNHRDITPDWNHKRKTCNVMINKRRLNRYFLLLLLDHFHVTDLEYTLCWKDLDLPRRTMLRLINDPVIEDIINRYQISLPARFYEIPGSTLEHHGMRLGANTNSMIYQQALQKNIFEPTYVSLITEPTMFERETMITEKTIMAIWGGNIPIWVGGWKIPQYLSSLGFDVFDDIVDHSYQSLDDPWQRCYQAINLNQSLLHDIQSCDRFFQNNRSRFQHNLDLLKSGVFARACWQQADASPADVRDQVWKIVNNFRYNYVRRPA